MRAPRERGQAGRGFLSFPFGLASWRRAMDYEMRKHRGRQRHQAYDIYGLSEVSVGSWH